MIYFLVLIGVYILHLLLKLNWIITGIICVYLLCVVPLHRKLFLQQKKQITRYEDASMYIDTLLYAFVKEKKVIRAFEDVVSTLRDGEMKEVVKQALDHMILTFDDSQILRNSMKIIEDRYPCDRIASIHRFMCHVEFFGGEVKTPVDLLLEDKNRWITRIDAAISERKKMFVEIVLSVSVSIVICGIILYLPVMNMDISNNWLVQILSAFIVVLDQIILYRGQKSLTVDWLRLDEMEDEEFYARKMQQYKEYDAKKDKRNSLLLSLIPAVVVVWCIFMQKEWFAAIALVITAVCLNQHLIGRKLATKRLCKNISSAFPKWLLDIVLLLQSENVQMALRKSIDMVPLVLKRELEDLNARLEIDPESSVPYHLFLKDFDLPEIHSAVGMLYALSIGNSSNADKQIGELISRNLVIMDIADTERLHNKNSGMYLLFLAPVLTASFKLLIDMAVFLLTFLSTKVV